MSETDTEKPAPDREETMETASTSTSNSGTTDEETLERAKEHMRNDQVLMAARLLNQMTSVPPSESAFQKEVEEKAALLEGVMADLLKAPQDEWLPMGESHNGQYDTVSYYQITEDLQLKCRIETPIESSLLVPLLSVLIETDLYTTWLPTWNVPKVGLDKVEKLAQMGRTEQIVHFISAVPWPFTSRDVVLQTCACDDIDGATGSIAIGLHSLQGGEVLHRSSVCNPHYMELAPEVLDIEPVVEGLKRAEFEGGLLIRKCPKDHVSLQHSTIDYPKDEHLILVGFSMHIDGKISPMFPQSIIIFVIQTVIIQMWAKFLSVAEEIRSGSRPQHAEHIAAKREEIYNWVEQRIEDMFDQLAKNGSNLKKEEAEEATDEAKEEKKVEGDAVPAS